MQWLKTETNQAPGLLIAAAQLRRWYGGDGEDFEQLCDALYNGDDDESAVRVTVGREPAVAIATEGGTQGWIPASGALPAVHVSYLEGATPREDIPALVRAIPLDEWTTLDLALKVPQGGMLLIDSTLPGREAEATAIGTGLAPGAYRMLLLFRDADTAQLLCHAFVPMPPGA